MSKKKHPARQKMANILMSIFVLAIFAIPTYLTARWVVGVARTRDPRSVVTVSALQTRRVDQTSTPITPFNEPLITISFDDGWESTYTKALPTLQHDGLHSTQYIITGTFDNYSYMSVAQLKSLHSAGHEIAGHTVSHPDLTTLDDAALTRELVNSQNTLQHYFGPIQDFTSPYGAYNQHTLDVIGKYYRSQKNAEGDPAANELEAINTKSTFNPLNFKSYSVRNTTTPEDLTKLIKAAQDNNGWLVLTYHQIDTSGEAFSVSPDNFNKQMQLVSGSKLRSATVGQVMDALSIKKAGS